MNQQHRQFFQAVESKLVESGRRTRQAIFAVLLFSFLLGCSSLTPERVNLLAQIAGLAAQEGARTWLKDHPEHRLVFEMVMAQIAALVKQGETREFKYSELLQSLPVDTLAGPDGAVYVTGTSKLSTNKEQDRIIVYDEGTGKPYHVGGDIRVQRQIVAGLKRAMLPLPPAPGKARTVPVWRSAVSFTGQHPVLSHDGTTYRTNQPGLTTPEPLPLSRTNVTRSGVEVTPHVGNWSHVTVSWQMGPRSVYHIENQVGTNWHCLGSITNISGTGPTNWVTKWPAFVPVGTWRVLRVR